MLYHRIYKHSVNWRVLILMNIIPWKKELEIGIELIDKQHKEFLMNANKFIIRVRAQKEIFAIVEELEFLENYLLYHFQAEETFQVQSQYPDYLNHQAEHKFMKFKVREMSTLLTEQNFSEESICMFCKFINEWITNHILNEDLRFSQYYNSLKK